MKPLLKRTLYRTLRLAGCYGLSRWWHRNQAVILTYHGVVGRGENNYIYRNCVSAAMFDRQMAHVARRYHVMPLPELVRRLVAREKLPAYTLAITFDDGFRNNATVAARILQKYRLPATVFLTTAFVDSMQLGLWTERVDWLLQTTHRPVVHFAVNGRVQPLTLATARDRIIASDVIRAHLKSLPPREREANIAQLAESIGGSRTLDAALEERYAFMTWEEVQALGSGALISFGSHTHTHAILSTLSTAEAHFELSESQRLIEAELGNACNLFSYPNGTARDFGRRDRELLQKLGYTAAVSQINGFNDHRTDRFALRRINIIRSDDFNFFLAKISGVWSLLKKMLRNI